MPKERDLLKILFTNIFNSLKPRQFRGNLKGADYMGNKYYEIPKSDGRRRTERWFTPVNKEDFEQEIPAEWESWLRFRRSDPPTEEEVLSNYNLMLSKKQKAAELEAKYRVESGQPVLENPKKGKESFPVYKDYEIQPGKKQT